MASQYRTDDLTAEEQAREREAGRQQALDTIKNNPAAAEKLMKARYDAAGKARGSITAQPITATSGLTSRAPEQPEPERRHDTKPTDPEAAEAAMRKRYEGN